MFVQTKCLATPCSSLKTYHKNNLVCLVKLTALYLASTGCLQYFQGVSGRIFSFNYNEATGLQLSDTDYSVCVRTERNFCGIQYSACTDTGIIEFYYNTLLKYKDVETLSENIRGKSLQL